MTSCPSYIKFYNKIVDKMNENLLVCVNELIFVYFYFDCLLVHMLSKYLMRSFFFSLQGFLEIVVVVVVCHLNLGFGSCCLQGDHTPGLTVVHLKQKYVPT